MKTYHTVEVEGLRIFYREAGKRTKPVILFLHGFPSSSHMFRNLMTALEGDFHMIAPDYPGFGNSSIPSADRFEYSFEHIAEIMEKFLEVVKLKRCSLYTMGYGVPIGFRVATSHPERIQHLIIQNGPAHEADLTDYWDPVKAYWKDRTPEKAVVLMNRLSLETTRWRFTHGARHPERINPDNWNLHQPILDSPGAKDIQVQLMYDYENNLSLFPKWQSYLREFQPHTLVVWGRNDPIFSEDTPHHFARDFRNVETHILNTGHFALEEEYDRVAKLIRKFISKRLLPESLERIVVQRVRAA